MKTNQVIYYLLIITFFVSQKQLLSQNKSDWEGGFPDGCTSITVGKSASADGSVITSHTDDSHRTRSWIDIVPAKEYKEGSTFMLYKRYPNDSLAMPAYNHEPIGAIPQIESTYGYINTAYPCMNEKQLAIGESTFGGRESLQSDDGLIDCQRLYQLILERCSSAREAIKMADELTKEYGWNDYGECLTISDKKEVWHFEILGPGKGQVGAIWVAQRVPDEHVSVNANASTIKEIDLKNPDYFMASENIFQVAKDSGWWKENEEPFSFCYVYAPKSRKSYASSRREWRVFDLLAPSLKLDPNARDYPFSIKPDEPVTLEKLISIFKDYYEGTEFNFAKDITYKNKKGEKVLSPLSNPFMPYDMNKVFNISGGWGWRGERTIARWYTMYATIIQSRDWMPDDVGGVVWLAMDNVASSIYVPVYCGVNDLAKPYKIPGRVNGYTRESAWWAFNRLGTLAAQRWGDMRHDLDAVWVPWQKELLDNQKTIEQNALKISDLKKRKQFLTKYTIKWENKVVNKAWELGDFLWTKYDEKF